MEKVFLKVEVPVRGAWKVTIKGVEYEVSAYAAHALIGAALAASFQYGKDAGFDAVYGIEVSRTKGGVL